MKRTSSLLLAASGIAAFTLVSQTLAAEPVFSPRAQEMLAWHKTVAASTEERLDRAIKPVSPRLEWSLKERQTVAAVIDPDLAHPQASVYGSFRNPFPRSVELAPLK